MPDSYSVPPHKARICRVAGAVFLLLAALNAAGILGAAMLPGGWSGECGELGCVLTERPADLLPMDDRAAVTASPVAMQTFSDYVAQPAVRLGLAGVALVDLGPFALLLLGVGLALRRLGRDGDPLARALPWLRLASIAAMVWALARPLSDSLLEMLLSPGTPSGPRWQITADLGEIGVALMLGIAAYATVWAMEAGLRAQRDLDSFV